MGKAFLLVVAGGVNRLDFHGDKFFKFTFGTQPGQYPVHVIPTRPPAVGQAKFFAPAFTEYCDLDLAGCGLVVFGISTGKKLHIAAKRCFCHVGKNAVVVRIKPVRATYDRPRCFGFERTDTANGSIAQCLLASVPEEWATFFCARLHSSLRGVCWRVSEELDDIAGHRLNLGIRPCVAASANAVARQSLWPSPPALHCQFAHIAIPVTPKIGRCPERTAILQPHVP